MTTISKDITSASNDVAQLIVDVRHIDDLMDTDIDAVIDTKLLGNSAWCIGPIGYHVISTLQESSKVWRCERCGAEEENPAYLIGSVGRHPRLVPRYTESVPMAWPIIEAIAALGRGTKVCFLLHLATQRRNRRAPLDSSLIFQLQPRAIAVAALKTVGIVDSYGFVIDRRGGSQ